MCTKKSYKFASILSLTHHKTHRLKEQPKKSFSPEKIWQNLPKAKRTAKLSSKASGLNVKIHFLTIRVCLFHWITKFVTIDPSFLHLLPFLNVFLNFLVHTKRNLPSTQRILTGNFLSILSFFIQFTIEEQFYCVRQP